MIQAFIAFLIAICKQRSRCNAENLDCIDTTGILATTLSECMGKSYQQNDHQRAVERLD